MGDLHINTTTLESGIKRLEKLKSDIEVRKTGALQTQGSGAAVIEIEKANKLLNDIEDAFIDLLGATIKALSDTTLFEDADKTIADIFKNGIAWLEGCKK